MHAMSFPHLYLAFPAFGPCTNIQSWGVQSKKDRKQALSMFLGGWVMATNDPNGGYGGHLAKQLRLRWAQFLNMSGMFNIRGTRRFDVRWIRYSDIPDKRRLM